MALVFYSKVLHILKGNSYIPEYLPEIGQCSAMLKSRRRGLKSRRREQEERAGGEQAICKGYGHRVREDHHRIREDHHRIHRVRKTIIGSTRYKGRPS